MNPTPHRFGVVVLISGRGSNLQAILDSVARGELPVEVRAVISNRPGVQGLERACRAGVPAITLEHTQFADRESFDRALCEIIDNFNPDLLIMAGFMRRLSSGFIAHYQGRMLNIHPSLLPKFPGLHTHERALAAGEREHGASVHLVTQELDSGPVILQARVPVRPGEDPTTLAARVLKQEHRIYPLAIRWFAEGRIRIRGDEVLFDDQPLTTPRLLELREEKHREV